MKKEILKEGGFTLIELLIAMSIFVTFTGILISSYTSILRAQRDANDYRVMYAEGRRTFEVLTDVLRDSMVDYGAYSRQQLLGAQSEIKLVSKDGLTKMKLSFDNRESGGKIILAETLIEEGQNSSLSISNYDKVLELNSDQIKIKKFFVYVTPSVDPYDQEFVDVDIVQFHPKITIYVEFEMESLTGRVYNFDLQTTISSRIYNQVYSY